MSDVRPDATCTVVDRNVQTTTFEATPPLLIEAMTPRQKRQFALLVGAWAMGLLLFYAWWFRFEHFAGSAKFLANTILLSFTLAMPAYFYFFVWRMKRVNPEVCVPRDWRVAMVTTRAPSEPFHVVRETLEAMLLQETPHDNWLADEDPTDEIRAWCAQHGVFLSTRKGVEEYHQAAWPRRTKCKEGNLAYFYDHYGYARYDFVVQLDADHVPAAGYLEAMLRPFVDSSIGYVSAPSVCDKNADTSWSARGRLYSESVLHGPLQAGYSSGFAPLCIGSHYAVRTAALREIGGLGPELAEDHSTTLMMNGHGWRGIHALDAAASGDGPETLADCLTQEFQWSRSLMVVMLTVLPKYWSRLPWHLRFQFLFSELWYPLFGMAMLCGTMLPAIAVLSGESWVRVSYVEFLLHSFPVMSLTLVILRFLQRGGWTRPATFPIVNWEVGLFQIIRWPWVVYGSLMGVVTTIGRWNVVFRVTPKGALPRPSLDWRILTPYVAIVLVTFLPTIAGVDAGEAQGYYFFLILSQVAYVAALFAIVGLHFRESVGKNHG